MKHLFFLSSVMISMIAGATVRTVSNFPATIAQFNTIQAAIDASSPGDTVYVHGSPNNYAAFDIIDKRIIVIGPGWGPDKQLPFAAVVNTDLGNSVIDITGVTSTGCEFNGLTIVGSSGVRINTSGIDNILFIRNHFTAPVFFTGSIGGVWSGYLFEGNIFNNSQVRSDNPTIQSFSNFLFQNNIFYETGCCVNGSITGFTNTSSILFDHNLWYGPGSGSRLCFASNCRFLLLTNNIFVGRDAATNNSFSTFNNNITFNAGINNPWAVNSNTNGGGNVENQDPQMAAQASVNAGVLNGLLDFTIAAGPANDSGSDTKDMGLLFDATGSLNWANSRNSRLPRIFTMNLITPTVSAGGNVTVQVEARTSN